MGRYLVKTEQIIATDLQTARTRQADLALTMTKPRSLLELLRRSDARLIRDDSDLKTVMLTQLDALQHDIRHNAYRDIWNGNTPQVEDDISDWIRRRLHERLTSGLVIDRELQVTRVRDGGIGTRIDLTATAHTQIHDIARVIIEAKRIDNRELLTGMHGQLITRYLAPIGRRQGIYLTYWITPAQRPPGWSTSTWTDAANLRQTLAEQAHSAKAEGWIITPYVLDISQTR